MTGTPPTEVERALALHRAGRLAEAAALYERALAARPDDVRALRNLGALRRAEGRLEAALALYARAAALAPDDPVLARNHGNALLAAGDWAGAAERLAAARARDPADPGLALALATARLAGGAAAAAAALAGEALARAADDPARRAAERLLALALARAGRDDEALPLLERLARAGDGDGELLHLAGRCALRLGRHEAAAARLGEAVARLPADAALRCHLGEAELALGRWEAAAASFGRAAELDPGSAAAHDGLGTALGRLGRHAEALSAFRRAAAAAPASPGIRHHLATALRATDDVEGAIEAWEATLRLDPSHGRALALLVHAKRQVCAWDGLAALDARLAARLAEDLAAGRPPAEPPFVHLTRADDPATSLALARARARDLRRQAGIAGPAFDHAGRRRPKERLRVGYLGGQWRSHPVLHTLAHVLPAHDRSRVEVLGYGWGRRDGSGFRAAAVAACARFTLLDGLTARAAAERVHADGIDVLVELTGHTEDARLEIAALRPAPVQAAWLGYVGTYGGGLVDYLIGDPVLTPPALEPFFDERFANLPPPFLAIGREAPPPGPAPTRADEGLPAAGPVLASFNGAHKLAPELFEAWLRILAAAPAAALWLALPEPAFARLRARAAAAGIDPARLVPARRIAVRAHLARLPLADLALDTVGYSGGATTAALLGAGVPVLTVAGRHPAARMSAALLAAQGLDELVRPDLAAYEATAVALARDPARLTALKARVRAAAADGPLLDPARLARALERAYAAMWARFAAGLPPASFEV